MSYSIETTGTFKKALKRCIKRGYDYSKFEEVINILGASGTLPPKYKPHIYRENIVGYGNVTYVLIGFFFGDKMIQILYWS